MNGVNVDQQTFRNPTHTERQGNYFFGTEKVFPLRLFIQGDKAWIIDSYIPELNITKGAEVISINNLSMPEIIHRLLPGFFSDGNNTTFKYIEMSHYFSAYYANLIESAG